MLTSKEPTKDLGRVSFGHPVTFTFQVENNATSTVTVNKVWAGCNSCTTTSMRKTKIEVGEVADINVIFTPGSLGKQKKHITVQYHDDVDKGTMVNLKLEFTAESYA